MDLDNNILHALISITQNIRKDLDDGNIGCRVFVDLQKAFNPILHDLLIIGDKKIFVVIYDFKVITKNVCIEIFVVAFSIWGFWSLLL